MVRKKRVLIVLFASVLALTGLWSCTYDYFEDETNYIVFVPEVLNRSVTDCRVMVYTTDGILVKERCAAYPWNKDPRIEQGLFAFHLPVAGDYKVYCYTNTDSISFNETGSLHTARFSLKTASGAASYYVQPSDILFQILSPTLLHPGMMLRDTTAVEKFTGRITVRFKNFPGDATSIKNVDLIAENIASHAYLKNDTLCTFAPDGLPNTMHHFGPNFSIFRSTDNILEVDHRFLPSVEGGLIRLNYTFLDDLGSEVIKLSVPVEDFSTGECINLRHGQRIIIEIDTYTVIKISIEGWNEDIQDGETNLE